MVSAWRRTPSRAGIELLEETALEAVLTAVCRRVFSQENFIIFSFLSKISAKRMIKVSSTFSKVAGLGRAQRVSGRRQRFGA